MLGRNPDNQLERPRVYAEARLIVSTEGSPTGVLDSEGQTVNPATEESLIELKTSVDALEGGQSKQDELAILEDILSVARGLATARGIVGDLRVTVVGGTTAVTGTLTGVTTVTTVSTVTNMAQVGGIPANSLVPAQLNAAAVASNINNIVVS